MNGTVQIQCDNNYWISYGPPGTSLDKQMACSWFAPTQQQYTDLGCTADMLKSFGPYHGSAPFTKTLAFAGRLPLTPYDNTCPSFTVDWGDGNPIQTYTPPYANYCNISLSHTWSTSGSYTIKHSLPTVGTNPSVTLKLNIRVDSSVTLAPNQTQLASALAALESALKAILKLLGQ